MTAIGVALLGAGNSGRYYHLPHLVDSQQFELRAVATANPGALPGAQLPASVARHTGWQDTVSRVDVELVVVALPHHLHYPAALAALDAGKHVLIEKPLALTTAEADELIALADERGLVLMVHQQRRWERDFQELAAIVRSGELGDPWRIVATRGHQGDYRTPSASSPHNGSDVVDWVRRPESGGGVARLIAPHPIDHVLELAGSGVRDVTANVALDEFGVEHWVAFELLFESGVTGRVEAFRRSGIPPAKFTVYGSLGTAVVRDGGALEVVRFDGERRSIEGLASPGVLGAEIYADLWAAIRNGIQPRVSAARGRDVVDVIERGLRSAF